MNNAWDSFTPIEHKLIKSAWQHLHSTGVPSTDHRPHTLDEFTARIVEGTQEL